MRARTVQTILTGSSLELFKLSNLIRRANHSALHQTSSSSPLEAPHPKFISTVHPQPHRCLARTQLARAGRNPVRAILANSQQTEQPPSQSQTRLWATSNRLSPLSGNLSKNETFSLHTRRKRFSFFSLQAKAFLLGVR